MKHQTEKKNYKDVAAIVLLIILLCTAFYLYRNETVKSLSPQTIQDKADKLCSEKVESVSICNGQLIRVTDQNQIKYIHNDGTTFSCPLTGSELSNECQAIEKARENNQWNCEEIC